jgi:hypothetical protein
MRVCGGVDFVKITGRVDGIGNDAVAILEAPAVFAHEPVDDRQADRLFKTLERPHDERPVRPRTGIGHIKMIAAGLRPESTPSGRTRRPVRRHPIAEMRGLPLEAASGLRCVIPFVEPLPFDQASHDASLLLSWEIAAKE